MSRRKEIMTRRKEIMARRKEIMTERKEGWKGDDGLNGISHLTVTSTHRTLPSRSPCPTSSFRRALRNPAPPLLRTLPNFGA